MPVPDYADPTPVRRQIADDLRAQIRAGRYAPGERLPPNTELAARYGVATATVRGALEELRAEKTVETRSTRGTYVMTAEPAERVRLNLETAGKQLADLAERVESYDDLRARVEQLEAQFGQMQADIRYLYDWSAIDYPPGAESEPAEKAPKRGRARR